MRISEEANGRQNDVTASPMEWLISVDDHVLEPGSVWQSRIPAAYRDAAPRLMRDETGEFWIYENKKMPTQGLSAAAGKDKIAFSPAPITYDEMRPGCYDPVARLADMDLAGIAASMCFPSFPRFCGQVFWEAQDKDLALLCVQAYNDWMIEEWCGAAPDRYIPLIIIPLWDPQQAAKEMERCAALGARSFAFSENPSPLGLPSINDPGRYWEPVMAAAADLELVVSMHVGSSSTVPKINPHSPFLADLTWGANRTSGAMLAWLFSGYFQRMPALKIALSEGEIGWIPYFLERAEQVYDKHRYWQQQGLSMDPEEAKLLMENLDIRQLYLDHVYGCFIDDEHGLNSLDVIGENNVMIETDYPHSDSSWPNCITLAQKRIAHLTPEVQHKLLRGNAERVYRFSAATTGGAGASPSAD
jgi:predicted TIM-barrel fold metal-dependent hydrolase